MFITCSYNLDMIWQEWITQRYLEWRVDKPGHAGSAASFAREIGITPQLMNEWINRGKVPTDYENIHKLLNFFGPVIYDVLGISRSEFPFNQLPSSLRDSLNTAMLEITTVLNARSIDPESPEAEEISRAILSKYGLTVKSISKSG